MTSGAAVPAPAASKSPPPRPTTRQRWGLSQHRSRASHHTSAPDSEGGVGFAILLHHDRSFDLQNSLSNQFKQSVRPLLIQSSNLLTTMARNRTLFSPERPSLISFAHHTGTHPASAALQINASTQTTACVLMENK